MENNVKKDSSFLPFFGIPRLIPYLKPFRKILTVMVVCGLGGSAVDILLPLLQRYALDHFIALKTLDTLPVYLALYVLAILFAAVMNFISCKGAMETEVSVNRDLRSAAFNHLQTLSFSYFNQNSVGYIHARVMSDTGKIGEAVSWRMMDCVWNGAYILFALVVMLMTDAYLAMWILLLMAVAGVLIWIFQSRLVKLNRKIREINSSITGNFNEGITGARSIKLLGVERRMQGEFEEETRNMRRTSVRASRFSALLISTVTLMSSLALALVLWQGQVLTRQGLLKIGTLSVFMTYALGMIEPLQIIIQNISAFISIQVNIERFTRL